MIDKLEEKKAYHIEFLQIENLIITGKYWDVDHLLYFRLVDICDEYKEKFNSDLISDLEEIFNNKNK